MLGDRDRVRARERRPGHRFGNPHPSRLSSESTIGIGGACTPRSTSRSMAFESVSCRRYGERAQIEGSSNRVLRTHYERTRVARTDRITRFGLLGGLHDLGRQPVGTGASHEISLY
jgi:hypothetical protein